MKSKWQPSSRTVAAYFDKKIYIEALAQSVEKVYAEAEKKPDILVCSIWCLID